MTDFDEKSGAVCLQTSWGQWWQTVDEVQVEVRLDHPIDARKIQLHIDTNRISLTVDGAIIFAGDLYRTVQTESSTWTLEDKRLIRILLAKGNAGADNLWLALLRSNHNSSSTDHQDTYPVDAFTADAMQKKLTLQRFQLEHPGMDFKDAEITGNYTSGGPPRLL